MAYDAMSVANFFLELADTDDEYRSVTHMKLQKLVYFAHGWHLGLFGTPLINERIQAWKYGPVVPSLYSEFQAYGSSPITGCVACVAPLDKADHTTREFLKLIWNSYKKFSALDLSSFTHQPGTPWSKTIEPYKDEPTFHHDMEISDALIKEYFSVEASKQK
ncbi:MAG: DUF4065 domain-containing protein [Capsulimonadaceae bacterium]|nr:DUF4065 domain-containing protein [Capsulimonadaceae bacterium]